MTNPEVLATRIANEVAQSTRYKPTSDNYARVWQGARKGALLALRAPAVSEEAVAWAGPEAFCIEIDVDRQAVAYLDIKGRQHPAPDNHARPLSPTTPTEEPQS